MLIYSILIRKEWFYEKIFCKLLCILLVFSLLSYENISSFSYATSTNYFISNTGKKVSEQEIIHALKTMDDVKIYSNSTNKQDEFAIQSLENKLNNRPSYSFRIVPAVYAVYTLVVLGVVYTLTIYNNGDILIKTGEKIIDAASAAGRAVMSAASNLISERQRKS